MYHYYKLFLAVLKIGTINKTRFANCENFFKRNFRQKGKKPNIVNSGRNPIGFLSWGRGIYSH